MSEEMVSIDQAPVMSRAIVTPTSLTLPADYTYEEAVKDARKLGVHHEATNWWIGDWLNGIEARFGETYAQVADDTGISPERLRQLKFVASRIPKPIRQSYLHWSHHRVVAVAELADEDRAVWLAKAIKNVWTSHELDKQIRGEPEQKKNGQPRGFLLSHEPDPTQPIIFNGNSYVRADTAIESVDTVKIELCAICGHSGELQLVCESCLPKPKRKRGRPKKSSERQER